MTIRRVTYLAVFGVLSMLASGARADIIDIGTPPPAYNSTLGAWAGAPTFQQQDKLYTFISASASLFDPTATPEVDTPVQFNLQVIDGLDNHTLTLAGGITGVALPAGVYDLDYTIELAGGGPGVSFQSVSLGATLAAPNAEATIRKILRDASGSVIDTLTVDASNLTDSTTLVGGHTFLEVEEHIVVTSGAVFGTTNTYVQNLVPEPGATALLGVAVMVGGVRYWLRRRIRRV
jgi:hypothetical protein